MRRMRYRKHITTKDVSKTFQIYPMFSLRRMYAGLMTYETYTCNID